VSFIGCRYAGRCLKCYRSRRGQCQRIPATTPAGDPESAEDQPDADHREQPEDDRAAFALADRPAGLYWDSIPPNPFKYSPSNLK